MRCASVCECTKVAICFMSALCCLMGCQENSNPESGHSEPIMSSSIRQSVQTIEVTTRDLEKTIQLPGSVLGFETAELFAKLGGYVSEVNVDIGDSSGTDTLISAYLHFAHHRIPLSALESLYLRSFP